MNGAVDQILTQQYFSCNSFTLKILLGPTPASNKQLEQNRDCAAAARKKSYTAHSSNSNVLKILPAKY